MSNNNDFVARRMAALWNAHLGNPYQFDYVRPKHGEKAMITVDQHLQDAAKAFMAAAEAATHLAALKQLHDPEGAALMREKARQLIGDAEAYSRDLQTIKQFNRT